MEVKDEVRDVVLRHRRGRRRVRGPVARRAGRAVRPGGGVVRRASGEDRRDRSAARPADGHLGPVRPAGAADGDRRPVVGGQGKHRRLRRDRRGRPGRGARDGEDMAGTGDGGDPSGDGAALAATGVALAELFREESGRLTAAVMRVLGDFELAEEVVQDALLAAWQQWPVDGMPRQPRAWLWTVARRRAVDVLRRDLRYREKLAALPPPGEPDDEDDRLRLMFTCCHSALAIDAQVALTLRTVCGLGTAEIASAFLISEAAVVQRLTRARRKIAAAGIPYRVPADDELGERVSGVLAVIYLLFNEGY